MKPSVYLETTIPSYLTAWRSPELVMAANQEATRSWWETARAKFDVFISILVLDEASSGDSEAAKRRLAIINEIPVLDISEQAVRSAAGFATPPLTFCD